MRRALEPDFRTVFQQAPVLHLLLAPDLRIVDASDAYLRATMTRRDEIVGRDLFEVFPDDPNDPRADGPANLRASLERVLATGAADAMPVQKYSLRRPAMGAGFELRYWHPFNAPVLDADGRVRFIVHRVEDATEAVLGQQLGADEHRVAEELRDRLRATEQEASRRSREAEEATCALREARDLASTTSRTLLAAEARARAILAALEEGIVVQDPSGAVTYANASAERLLGTPGATLVGRGPRDARYGVVREDGSPLAPEEQPSMVTLRTGQPQTNRVVGVRPGGGELLWLSVNSQPLFVGDDPKPAGVVSSFFDITVRKRAEEMARRAYEAARDADRRKDEFLAMLGHELRNPLAPIATALQLIRLRGAPPGLEHDLAIAERQVRHLIGLVEDLLDVSRITRGKIKLKKERFEIGRAVSEAIEMAAPSLEEGAHRLEVHVPREGLLVDGDPVRLAQVVANLLTNAAKYTDPRGQITLTAERDHGQVVVRVRDTGVGIPPEMLPHVFEPFTQGARTIDRAQGGLGIGLAIVRSLVQLHGGTVTAASDGPGRGSEFTVRLPAAVGASRPHRAHPASPRPPLRDGTPRVLVVDDNEDAAELLAEALRLFGYTVDVAHDGPEALRAAAARPPDVALLDIGLPVMDGYELARRLRADPSLRAIKLVAITGYGQEADRQRAREAGFDVHLVKPVEIGALCRLLEKLRPRPEPTVEARAP